MMINWWISLIGFRLDHYTILFIHLKCVSSQNETVCDNAHLTTNCHVARAVAAMVFAFSLVLSFEPHQALLVSMSGPLLQFSSVRHMYCIRFADHRFQGLWQVSEKINVCIPTLQHVFANLSVISLVQKFPSWNSESIDYSDWCT
jgi:hypothetical protein